MSQDNYQAIPKLLEGLRPFHGHTMHACGDVDTVGYFVYSYDTEIARVLRDPETGRFVRTINRTRYSTTTSRQQNLCKAHLPGTDA